MSAEKADRALFLRWGTRDYVETGSTGTDLVSYGTSICGDGIYTLGAPNYLGQNKMLIMNSSNAEIQTDSSGVNFQGTTFNRISATTALNSTENPAFVRLVGASTAAWWLDYSNSLVFATTVGEQTWTAAAATQA